MMLSRWPGLFLILVFLGASAPAGAATELENKLNGVWEYAGDEDFYDDYVIGLNFSAMTFEETVIINDAVLRKLNPQYSYGKFKIVSQTADRLVGELVYGNPLPVTIKKGEDGSLKMLMGRQVTAEDEQANPGYEYSFTRFLPRGETDGLSGRWKMEELEHEIVIDQKKGLYAADSTLEKSRAGFKIIETLPDRFFVELTGYTLNNTFVLNPDGTMTLFLEDPDYAETFKKVDLKAAREQKAKEAERRRVDSAAQNMLHQLALASVACQFDEPQTDPKRCRVTKGNDPRTVLELLTTYGLRPDPQVGLFLPAREMLAEEALEDGSETGGLYFVAAHNSPGAQVFYYESGAGVLPLTAGSRPPAPLDGALHFYIYDGSQPEGARISGPRPGPRFDPATGLVTAVAP